MFRGIVFAIGLIAASPCAAQVVSPLTYGGSDQTAMDAANAAQATANSARASADSAVKSVNGLTPTAGAVTVPLPTASTQAPPCIADAGAAGTAATMVYAPWNHTHCSKTRRIAATTAADGTYTFTYSAFTSPPVCVAVAEVASGVTDVINVQIIGTPTTTSASFLVNRTNRSTVALLGLTILSVPTSPGATKIHALCIEP